ncbi:hypothetical protein C5Y96_11595 [Blastopirellula marina]|uniref:Uncharacterized protein n=1 Tax=Blastopirellula marina TaxID=124 RepID=A0A2S8FMQ8_9BACT|nr:MULTISPECIES: hypothetical protein [Pirellulaceae]PQO33475.1 hypothetical protein C5Y96_11595 [Blastopirellula marina]RCS52566.1 hypothetical protein DTL36_11605 [Bremerella cremea]
MPEFLIVLHRKVPGIPEEVPGTEIAKSEIFLARLARKLGVVSLNDFKSQSPAVTDALAQINGLDLSDVKLDKETWYAPAQGLQTVSALRDHLRSHPAAIPNTNQVLEELDLWNHVLTMATKEGVPWHLLVSI